MTDVEFLCTDCSLSCTDGAQADVDRVRQLAQKVFGNMTADEKTKLLNGLKGSSNASGLNRVGASVAYVAGRLSQEEFDQLVGAEK